MEISIKVRDEREVERIMLILILGISTALERKVISIEEAENFLYSPYSMERLKKIGVKENIVNLIHLGSELENVERLIPDKLLVSIDDIKERALEILQKIPKDTMPTKKWLD